MLSDCLTYRVTLDPSERADLDLPSVPIVVPHGALVPVDNCLSNEQGIGRDGKGREDVGPEPLEEEDAVALALWADEQQLNTVFVGIEDESGLQVERNRSIDFVDHAVQPEGSKIESNFACEGQCTDIQEPEML